MPQLQPTQHLESLGKTPQVSMLYADRDGAIRRKTNPTSDYKTTAAS